MLGTERILSQAKEEERGYNWVGAAELYERALTLVSEQDFLRNGEIHECLGYAYYRGAMQAGSASEFRATCSKAVDDYEKAREFYGRSSGINKVSRMLRCDAMIAYLGYWLACEAAEKKMLIGECWRATKKALEAFEKGGETREYAKTYNQLSMSVILAVPLEWDFRTREKTRARNAAGAGNCFNHICLYNLRPHSRRCGWLRKIRTC